MRVARVFQIQPGEGRTVSLVVAVMFLAVAGLTVGESGIGALFFERVGPERLPQMYLAQGLGGVVMMLLASSALGRFDRRRAYVVLPLLLAGLLAVERIIVAADPSWIYPAMWLTITLGYLVQAVCLWGMAGLVTDTRRAKRQFPLFGAGSILGAVVGGLATRPLAAGIGAENLLVVWVVALVGTSTLSAVVLDVRRRRARPARVRSRRRHGGLGELRQGFAFVRRSPLLVWMSLGAVLFSLLFFSLYLPWAEAATARYPDAEELAGFFGIFWAAVTAAAFLVSMLVTNRLLGWFGAAAMVLALPILYVGAFGTLLVTSTFATLVAVRVGVNVWLQGVTSPSWETLINVVPEHRLDQTRAFMNGGPAQAGTAIAGILQLVGQQALSPRQLPLIGLGVGLVTVWVAWRIRRSYPTALADAIRAGRPRVFDRAIPNAPIAISDDPRALALALTAIEDADPRVRRLACELLAGVADPSGAGALRRAREDPDPLVRAHALEAAGAAGWLDAAELERAIRDADAQVRLAAVRTLGAGRVPSSLLEEDDPEVAAAVAVRSLVGPSRARARETLERLLGSDDAEIRRLVVEELGLEAPPDDLAALLPPLVDDPSAAVRGAAVGALATAEPAVAVRAALKGLASDDAALRATALDVLTEVDLRGFEADLQGFTGSRASIATRDLRLAASIPVDGDAPRLLVDALLSRGRANALVALSALTLTSSDPRAMRIAVEQLSEGGAVQVANALETIEASARSQVVRSLLGLWEPAARGPGAEVDPSVWDRLAAHDDEFIRACAERARASPDEGDPMARTKRSMSPMELVLVLRKIPLFSELAPVDLQRVAAIADEKTYSAGDVIGAEGELGDEMHIVLEGTVRVVRGDGETIVRRGERDVIGEMSIISRAPRIASLIADGDVRTLRIGHREFDAMLRDRPEIALAIMRVLAERLTALSSPIPERARAPRS